MPAFAKSAALSLSVAAIAGCDFVREEPALFLLDSPPAEETLRNRLGRVEVREVSLPQYAAGQEIVVQGPDGALRADPNALWADAPARSLTRALATQIGGLSGATALAEPWPLAEPADRRLEVRVDRMYAAADGTFRLSGQYVIAPTDPEARDIVRRFDIAEPLPRGPDGEDGGAAAIAAAQTAAVRTLARNIAQLE